jgi:hypothetical protein
MSSHGPATAFSTFSRSVLSAVMTVAGQRPFSGLVKLVGFHAAVAQPVRADLLRKIHCSACACHHQRVVGTRDSCFNSNALHVQSHLQSTSAHVNSTKNRCRVNAVSSSGPITRHSYCSEATGTLWESQGFAAPGAAVTPQLVLGRSPAHLPGCSYHRSHSSIDTIHPRPHAPRL